MTTSVHPLERRRIATEATIARFAGHVLDYGTDDCAKMTAFHLRQLGISIGIAKSGAYSGALGAKRALKRMGAASLSEVLDRHFARIAPAAALLGDLFIVPGDLFEAVWIATGNGTALGWHEDAEGCAIIRCSFVETTAWRVL